MTYITIKTKETNANIKIYPPTVLDRISHISLADIKIPEEVTKSFTFTERQAIATEPDGRDPKIIPFPKGVYNIHKLQDMVNNNPPNKNIGLNIRTTNNKIYIETKSNTIKISTELAQTLGIPKTLPPFSSVKISGNEKYLINCNLVETNSSYSFKATPGAVYPSRLLAAAPSRNGCYPELSIESGKNIINNLTLEILTENLETPDFGDNEITYVLKAW